MGPTAKVKTTKLMAGTERAEATSRGNDVEELSCGSKRNQET
jgi:hypothetical protein